MKFSVGSVSGSSRFTIGRSEKLITSSALLREPSDMPRSLPKGKGKSSSVDEEFDCKFGAGRDGRSGLSRLFGSTSLGGSGRD